jgi:hypothetical protein
VKENCKTIEKSTGNANPHQLILIVYNSNNNVQPSVTTNGNTSTLTILVQSRRHDDIQIGSIVRIESIATVSATSNNKPLASNR